MLLSMSLELSELTSLPSPCPAAELSASPPATTAAPRLSLLPVGLCLPEDFEAGLSLAGTFDPGPEVEFVPAPFSDDGFFVQNQPVRDVDSVTTLSADTRINRFDAAWTSTFSASSRSLRRTPLSTVKGPSDPAESCRSLDCIGGVAGSSSTPTCLSTCVFDEESVTSTG